MTEKNPFSIRIFVTNGDPDGLRLIDRSNWNGRALVFPRNLLLGPRVDSDGEMIYIGKGDPVKPRLESHYLLKDFWNRAVFFVAGQEGALNTAHVQYLESRLIQLAHAAKRLPLDNQNKPNLPTLNEADVADMEVFLSHILQILPLLGINAFEMPEANKSFNKISLHLTTKGINAEGYESTSGFVVLAGSEAVPKIAASMKTHIRGIYDLRQNLIETGVMVKKANSYRFSQDYSFSSPSTAADIVMGRSANGRIEWKDKYGTTLKELQEAITDED